MGDSKEFACIEDTQCVLYNGQGENKTRKGEAMKTKNSMMTTRNTTWDEMVALYVQAKDLENGKLYAKATAIKCDIQDWFMASPMERIAEIFSALDNDKKELAKTIYQDFVSSVDFGWDQFRGYWDREYYWGLEIAKMQNKYVEDVTAYKDELLAAQNTIAGLNAKVAWQGAEIDRLKKTIEKARGVLSGLAW